VRDLDIIHNELRLKDLESVANLLVYLLFYSSHCVNCDAELQGESPNARHRQRKEDSDGLHIASRLITHHHLDDIDEGESVA
jgi:hypothetical protein